MEPEGTKPTGAAPAHGPDAMKRRRDKVMSLASAVREIVQDGGSVAMGLCLESLIPFAAGHEIIRQQKKGLTLIGPISDMLFDQMIGAACVRAVVAAWVGNVAAGLAHNLRRAAEQGVPGPLAFHDHTNLTLALGLKAAAQGVSFLPTRTAAGTDIVRDETAFAPVTCPFTGERLTAVRAIVPDVAILHVQRADAFGNAQLWGNLGVAVEAAYAAGRVIVTCEELVDTEVVRSDPNRTLVPGILVDAVVPEPLGAHPSPVQGYWKRDDEEFVQYHERSRTREGFLEWLGERVLLACDRAAYRAGLGRERQDELRVRTPRLPWREADYGFF